MFWVKTKGRNLNLAQADEITNSQIEENDPRFTGENDGVTHSVQAVWLGAREYEYVLFAGTEEQCDAYEERLMQFYLGVYDLGDINPYKKLGQQEKKHEQKS